MIKKIVSSIIIIMLICSTYVFANNTIITDPSTNTSQEQESSDANSGVEDTNHNLEKNEEENVNHQNSNNNVNNDNNDKSETNINQSENNEDTSKKEETTSKKTTQTNFTTTSSDVEIKSSEARLKDLKIDIEGITPEFNTNITEYYLVVDLNVERIKITAIPQDDKAKVSVEGNNNLEEGENTITINVTAEDGIIKKYYIYVTKVDNVEMANAELEILEIEGFTLYPNFKSDIYTYNLNIDKDVKELNINARPQRENATVQIVGNADLHKGENMIEIKVTAEDGVTIKTYKINTYINADIVSIEEESKMLAIILIVVLGIGIIILGVYIFLKKSK